MEHPAFSVNQSNPEAVLTKSVLRAAAQLGLNQAQLAQTLGYSRSHVSKLANGTKCLSRGTHPYQFAALLVRVFRSLDAIVGGETQVLRTWMDSENKARNARPIDLITQPQGLLHVLSYLDASRAKI